MRTTSWRSTSGNSLPRRCRRTWVKRSLGSPDEDRLRNEGLKRVRMRLITAVVFVFTLTCSGSFGMEDVVSSSGPGDDAPDDPHPAARVERADGVRRLGARIHGPRGGRSVPLDPPRHGRVLEFPGRLVVDALALRRLRRLRGPGRSTTCRTSGGSARPNSAHRRRHRGERSRSSTSAVWS